MNITTKDEYLNALAKALGSLSEMERMDAMQYYREYFEEAGGENEEKVIAELGAPKKLAAQIRAQTAVKKAKEDPNSGKKSLRAVWLAVLSVFAVPVGVPIAIVLAAMVLVLLIVLFTLILSFYIIAVSFALTAVVCLLLSIFAFISNLGASMMLLGSALILAGLAGIFFVPTLLFTRWSMRKLAALAGKISCLTRRDSGN